ncbi:MAG: hypothetical protein R6U31_05050 [bacterium]
MNIVFIAVSLTSLIIPRIDSPPDIDGYIGKSEWSNAHRRDSVFIETYPQLGDTLDDKTVVYLMSDNENLYIAMSGVQDTSEIISRKCTRDNLNQQDKMGVVIDPMGNKQEQYYIIIGMPGAITDYRKTLDKHGTDTDLTWDSEIEYSMRRTDKGIDLEMKIPFNNFRMLTEDTITWNMNFYRYVSYKNESGFSYGPQSRNPTDEFNALEPYSLQGVKRNREKLQLMPYSVYGNDFAADKTYANAGFDVKIPRQSSSVINIAFNPDYSQLEGDPLYMDFNNRYPIYLSEYRPFFIEEQGVFDTDREIFYSRAIENPYVAGRYTYKGEKSQGGVIAAYDKTDTMISNSNAFAGLGRWRYMFNGSDMGIMTLYRYDRDSNYSNAVVSADGMFRWPGLWRHNFVTGVSYTDSLEQSYGFYYDEFSRYITDNWSAVIHVGGVDPLFNNDMGYITDNDNQHIGGYLARTFRMENSFLKSIRIAEDFGFDTRWNTPQYFITQFSDSVEYYQSLDINADIFSNTHTGISYKWIRSDVYNTMLTYTYPDIYMYSRINKYISLNGYTRFGYGIDYTKVNVGKYFYMNAGTNITPLPELSFWASYSYQEFGTDTSVRAMHIDMLNEITSQWKTHSVTTGASVSPVNFMNIECIYERIYADFEEDYFYESEYSEITDRIFFLLEYEYDSHKNLYIGYRYQKNANSESSPNIESLLFFKFTGLFKI